MRLVVLVQPQAQPPPLMRCLVQRLVPGPVPVEMLALVLVQNET